MGAKGGRGVGLGGEGWAWVEGWVRGGEGGGGGVRWGWGGRALKENRDVQPKS